MKTLKTNESLKDLKGEEIKEGEIAITIGLIITNTLSGQTTNPHEAYKLAKKISENDSVDLKAEDVVFIKEQLKASKMPALYIGQVMEILDSKDAE
jgi:hypothetical protein